MPCLPVAPRGGARTTWEGHRPPALSHFPRRRAEESRVQVRMYRCSSLSISFRWIPNFCTGRTQSVRSETHARCPAGRHSIPARAAPRQDTQSAGGARPGQREGAQTQACGELWHWPRQRDPLQETTDAPAPRESTRGRKYAMPAEGAPRCRSQARLGERAGLTLGLRRLQGAGLPCLSCPTELSPTPTPCSPPFPACMSPAQ